MKNFYSMLKPRQELGVNNSSNQQGTAQKSSLETLQLMEDVMKAAVALQVKFNSLYEVDFVKEMYFEEVCHADNDIYGIIDTLTGLVGRAYAERLKDGGAAA